MDERTNKRNWAPYWGRCPQSRLSGYDKVGKQASAACRHRPQFVGTGRKEKRREKKKKGGKRKKKEKKRKERGKKEKKEEEKKKKRRKEGKRIVILYTLIRMTN